VGAGAKPDPHDSVMVRVSDVAGPRGPLAESSYPPPTRSRAGWEAPLLHLTMNVLESARESGASVERIASFIHEVGSHWAPIILSTAAVERREAAAMAI